MPITVYSSEEGDPSADDTPAKEDEGSTEEVETESSQGDEARWIEFLTAFLNLVPDPSGQQLHFLVKSLGLDVEKEASILAAVVDLVAKIQDDGLSESEEEDDFEEDEEEDDEDEEDDESDTGLEDDEEDPAEKVASDAELTDALDEILTNDGESSTKPSPDDLALLDDGAPMTEQDRNPPLMTNDGDKILPVANPDED